MAFNSFISGLGIGLSLIMAIGAQNTFVFRQGLMKEYVWLCILFCTFSDGILIFSGTYGIGTMITPHFERMGSTIYLITALWVGLYGLARLRSALFHSNSLTISNNKKDGLYGIISTLFLMTWLNPHVYLDTLILIGSLSIPFGPDYRLPFAIGATLASFIFFSVLGLGAVKLSPFFSSRKAWKLVEIFTSIIMFIFCLSFLKLGGWV